MNLVGTQTCAMQEICNIGYHKDAEEVMKLFCQATFGRVPDKGNTFRGAPVEGRNNGINGYTMGYQGHLWSFYCWAMPVKTGGKVEPVYNPAGIKSMGQQLEDFIVTNKLGDVVATKEVVNAAFHPDHSNKAWIWSPDQEKVKAWWDKYQKDHPEAKPKPVVATAAAPVGQVIIGNPWNA